MITKLNVATVYVLDKDEALDFYVGKLGLEKGNDVQQGDYRWLTVRVPGGQTEINLEKPGAPQVPAFDPAEARGRAQALRVTRHPLGVAAGVVVLGVEGRGQADQHVLGPLQLVDERLRPQEVAGAGEKLFRVDRLGEEVVAAGSDAVDPVLARDEAGDQNDRDERRALVVLEDAAGLEAVHARHGHVHEDEVGWIGERPVHGFPPVLCRVDEMALRLEETGQDLPVLRQVVDDQHSDLLHHPPRRRRNAHILLCARRYLASRVRLGMKFGLDVMHALLGALDRPDHAYPVLLVAGTNGKGSVTACVETGLRAAGLRTGRYTSPHLVRLEERIAVGGRPIAPAALDRAVTRVRQAATSLVSQGVIAAHPTFFEVVTAAAFWHFRERRVDVAVIEVGLGGRLDATNASDPLVSAIVTIGRDHQEFLGDTLGSIAREKAGVLRPGRTTVIGALPVAARAAVERESARVGSVLVAAPVARIRAPRHVEVETSRRLYRDVPTLPGAHQAGNVAVAVTMLEEAAAAGLPFDPAAAVRGLGGARWPGRLQHVPGRPPLLLDGAHNLDGARALAAELATVGPYVLVFGAMQDKDVTGMARVLFPRARAIVLTRTALPRAAAPADLRRRAGTVAQRAVLAPSPARALDKAARLAGPDATVVVAGSLYLVGNVLALLERRGRLRV